MAQKAAGGGPCLFVGDSCTQDIAGAAACGWQTIWMNRRGEAPGTFAPAAQSQASRRCSTACKRSRIPRKVDTAPDKHACPGLHAAL
ncbi:MAG: HAD hydrolase-like protein [Acutalibacteraceae bacterium]